MIKHFSFFANWRKKDVKFLNQFKLNRKIEEGYFGFGIQEGDSHDKILEHFTKPDSLFYKAKPPRFSHRFATVTFSKEELDSAEYYALTFTGESKGSPLPEDTYIEKTFSFTCDKWLCGKEQKNLFRIKKPRWKKNQVNFILGNPDFMFFRKDFFIEILQPLGLKSKSVIIHSTRKISEDVIQLDIPEAKSKLLINGSTYDKEKPCDTCGKKQYSVQTLDFFPAFENNFNFLICRTQEEFLGGRRQIIVSKVFCNLLVKYKIIKYDTNNLTPMK